MDLTWMKDVTVCYTPLWNVILSILRSQTNFWTMEIHLGSQNWQDYISKGCVTYHNILHSSEICTATELGVGNMYIIRLHSPIYMCNMEYSYMLQKYIWHTYTIICIASSIHKSVKLRMIVFQFLLSHVWCLVQESKYLFEFSLCSIPQIWSGN